jgi:hypothetical protein
MTYSWERYADADTFDGEVELIGGPDGWVRLVAPPVNEAKTIHLILAVQDHGIPRLTRYGRVIVTIKPGN